MKIKFLLISLLFSLVFISGCTQQNDVAGDYQRIRQQPESDIEKEILVLPSSSM